MGNDRDRAESGRRRGGGNELGTHRWGKRNGRELWLRQLHLDIPGGVAGPQHDLSLKHVISRRGSRQDHGSRAYGDGATRRELGLLAGVTDGAPADLVGQAGVERNTLLVL